jgi:hypothetical protein
MKATITGMSNNLNDEAQQDLGRFWLMMLNAMGSNVDGVKIEFEKE